MTFFSRCESESRFDPVLHSPNVGRIRVKHRGTGIRAAMTGFAEDLGILFLYAAGLDYYGGQVQKPNR